MGQEGRIKQDAGTKARHKGVQNFLVTGALYDTYAHKKAEILGHGGVGISDTLPLARGAFDHEAKRLGARLKDGIGQGAKGRETGSRPARKDHTDKGGAKDTKAHGRALAKGAERHARAARGLKSHSPDK
jgi:hypothetical protein